MNKDNIKKVEKLITQLLIEIGENPDRDGIIRTPHRVAKAWSFLSQGYHANLEEIINNAIFDEDCNDMVVDDFGRAYVGNFGGPVTKDDSPLIPANLILIDTNYQVSIAATDLLMPNGVVITPDGKTLIVAESFGDRLTAFDINENGTLTGRRVWATFDSHPDGICIDVENHIWVATIPHRNALGKPGSVLRVKDGGDIVDRIDIDGYK